MVYTYNGMLFSLKKEGNPIICNSKDRYRRNYAKGKVCYRRTNTAWFHLYEVSKTVKFIEAENRMVVASGWGEERNGAFFNGYKATVIQNK